MVPWHGRQNKNEYAQWKHKRARADEHAQKHPPPVHIIHSSRNLQALPTHKSNMADAQRVSETSWGMRVSDSLNIHTTQSYPKPTKNTQSWICNSNCVCERGRPMIRHIWMWVIHENFNIFVFWHFRWYFKLGSSYDVIVCTHYHLISPAMRNQVDKLFLKIAPCHR